MIRLGAVGDVVRTLPAVTSLRAACPGSQIAWLVEPAAASLLGDQPWIDDVIVFPREALVEALRARRPGRALGEARRFLRGLRRQRFDLAIDFHGILRSGVLSALSGARRRVGYGRPFGRELSYAFASERARLSPARISRFERNAALLRYLGVSAPPAHPPLVVAEAARRRARAQLAGRAPVAIHPGTSDATPYKRYAVAAWAEVARGLTRDGAPVIVTRGPARADQALAESVVAASGGAAQLAPSTPGLTDLAALFAACRLTLGSDSGPLHVASLVGTPVVQLLGPTDPVENAPWAGTPSRSLRGRLACSPCRRGCAAATCMRVIPASAVVAAARELLADAPARAGGRAS